MDVAARINSCLVGNHLLNVERREHDWIFLFENKVGLQVECRWRILVEGRIAFGDKDHAQQFGLPEPIDGADRSNSLLLNKTIQGVKIREDTGDLTIIFTDRCALEVLNTSCGYEGWQIIDGAGLHVVAMGGGELSLWNDPD